MLSYEEILKRVEQHSQRYPHRYSVRVRADSAEGILEIHPDGADWSGPGDQWVWLTRAVAAQRLRGSRRAGHKIQRFR